MRSTGRRRSRPPRRACNSRAERAGTAAVLASPISTLEELALTAKVARGLGTQNVDHRLRRIDFRDQANDPVAPKLGCSIAELEQAAGVLVVGYDVRKEVPLIAHRIRQGAIRRGAKVAFINPRPLDLRFPVVAQLTSNGYGMAQRVAAVLLAALRAAGTPAPATVAASLEGIKPTSQHEAVASALGSGELKVVLLSALAQRHVAYAEIRSLAQALAGHGRGLGYLPEGGNVRRRAGGRAAASHAPAAGPYLILGLRS